ncbi:hypothetical protein BQ8482_360045 [Mesorhizobium delmotii]|uniref:Uncharacterized protein n=1 Tax=Mesorhizobium delmotii TaxID=1631247 RepID=A0A2P9AR72_9HYPH|nr:hypothetical protein BQ8482_360045 [Mesorhizobium delmotii]
MTALPELRSKARRLIPDMVNSPLHFMAGWQIGIVNTGRPLAQFLSGWVALSSALQPGRPPGSGLSRTCSIDQFPSDVEREKPSPLRKFTRARPNSGP